jgi:hypothetical protein
MIGCANALDGVGVRAVAHAARRGEPGAFGNFSSHFLTRLLGFGPDARNLDAGVGTGSLRLGLRRTQGLFRVNAGVLGVGLRRPQRLFRFSADTLGLDSRLFDVPVGRGDFATRVVEFRNYPFDFGARRDYFGLDTRDLNAGVRAKLLRLGLRGQRALSGFRAGTIGVGSNLFDLPAGRGGFTTSSFQFAGCLRELAARLFNLGLGSPDLGGGVRSSGLNVSLRGPYGLLRFRAGMLRLGARFFNFAVCHGRFAAGVGQVAVRLLDLAARLLDLGLGARDFGGGVRMQLLSLRVRGP